MQPVSLTARLGRGLLMLLAAFSPAHADDEPTARDSASDVVAPAVTLLHRAREATDVPLLHLDDMFGAITDTPAAVVHDTHVLALGRRVRLSSDAAWWTATLPGFEGASRGWRSTHELSSDLGGFRVALSAGAGHVDNRLERGTSRFVGVSATRTFRLSRWMLAWISLGAGVQQWSGLPPLGESNGASVKLTIGTTFR